MIKLFKEVFKSLSKNKVVIIGLTFLVFLTSAIFTLLFNLRSSFNSQFGDYKKISKVHDVTADLNLPSSGSAYGGGYFVNDFLKEDQYGKDNAGNYVTSKEWKDKYGKREWDDPIAFIPKDDWNKAPSYKVDLYAEASEKDQGYIALKRFDVSFPADLYIRKIDFNSIYTNYLISKESASKPKHYQFSLKDYDSTFRLNKTVYDNLVASRKQPTIFVYRKNGNNYEPNLEKKEILFTDVFTLETTYTNPTTVSKLINFQDSEDGTKIYFKNISPAYFNFVTKKITFDYFEAKSWLDLGIGFKISEQNVAKLFKLKSDTTYPKLFVRDDSVSANFFDHKITVDGKGNKTLTWNIVKDTITFTELQAFALEEIKEQFFSRFKLLTNKVEIDVFDIRDNLFVPEHDYKIDKNFVFKELQINKYFLKHYASTYSDLKVRNTKTDVKYKDLWTGSFGSFMSKISDYLNPENEDYIRTYGSFKEYEKLSYWSKKAIVFAWRADTNLFNLQTNLFNFEEINNPNLIIKGAEKNSYNTVVIEDLDRELYRFNDNETGLFLDAGKLKEESILKIEKAYHEGWDKLSDEEIISQIYNPNIKNKYFARIAKGAEFFNIQESTKEVIRMVGAENVGYRQTLTVDGFNEDTNEKNVFHFINAGNENFEIDGVKLNVGKLYNEYYEPTILNEISSSKSTFYKTNQLPTYVAAKVVNQIFKNINPDPKYFDTDIRFDRVGIVSNFTNETKYYNSQKVVVLAKYSVDQSNVNQTVFNEAGTDFEYAITMLQNKFILLKRKVGDFTWTSVNPEAFTDEKIRQTNNRMSVVEMERLFINNNFFTLHYNTPIEKRGWAKEDPLFKNFIYIPMIFRAPHNELLTEAFKTGTVDFMMASVEKVLLNLDLVKNNFIDVEFISKFIPVAKDVLQKANFGQVFASGILNLKIVTPLMLDVFYEVTKSNPGILNKLFTNFFQQIKIQIIERPDFVSYFTEQYNKLKFLFKHVFNVNFIDAIPADVLIQISNNSSTMVDALSEIVNSIDFKKWLDILHEFLHAKDADGNKLYYGSFDKDNYERGISSIDLIKPLLYSIDTNQLSKSLIKLVESIDFNRLLGPENSILSSFISKDNQIWKLLPKINQNKDKNHPENNFKEFKQGLIKLIEIIDLKSFFAKLNLDSFEGERVEIFYSPSIINGIEDPSIIHKVRVGMFKLSDIISAFLESLFEGKQNNVVIKKTIIEMFNLSSKTSQAAGAPGINIPANDPDKIGIFDLLSLTSLFDSGEKTSEFDTYYNLKIKVENVTEKLIDKNTLRSSEIKFINYYLGIDTSLINYLSTDELRNKLSKFERLSNLLIGDDSLVKYANTFLEIGQTNGTIGLITDTFNKLLKVPDTKQGQAITMSPLYFYLTKLFTYIDNVDDARYVATKLLELIFLPGSKPILDELSSEKLEPQEPNISNFNALKTVSGLINFRNIANKWSDFTNQPYLKNFIANDPILSKYLFAKTKDGNTVYETLKYDTFYYFAMLASSKKFTKNTGFLDLENGSYFYNQKQFIDLVTRPENYQVKDFLTKFIFKNSKTSQLLLNLNLPPIMINPYLTPINTGILLWFITNTNTTGESQTTGNLQHILLNKLVDFEALTNDKVWLKNFTSTILLDMLPEQENFYHLLSQDQDTNLIIDNAYFDYLDKLNKENALTTFGMNLINLINESIGSITYQNPRDDIINFNDVGGYVAKVNYLYLILNNKEIYQPTKDFKLPNDPVEIQKLIAQLDDKYILNVNGSKFIIIGEETTVDYLYPVIDENNLQVNTKNQAIVYVNNKGFDRIKNAYQGNVIKKYLLISNKTEKTDEQLRDDIQAAISRITGPSDVIKRAYLQSEVDPINPERAIRLIMPVSVINMVDQSTTLIIVTLVTLVALSVIFIIRRYIASKSKVLGILISQGYNKWEIATSLLVFSAVTSIIGGVLGYTIGSQLQIFLMDIFSNYWTLPKQKIPFNWFSMIFTVFIPFLGTSALIFVVTILMLQTKSIELMRGTNDLAFVKTQTKISKASKFNIKQKFSISLILNSLGKLFAFMFSILLTTIVSAFSIVSIGKFESITKETYRNRYYNYKIDMETPTIEGGIYRTYGSHELENLIYTPTGTSNEIETTLYNYFRPGYSKAINLGGKNGNIAQDSKQFEPHIITQFSVNIAIEGGVSVDPWQITYNSMPDTQKAKVNAIRDSVGYALQNVVNKEYEIHYNLHDMAVNKVCNDLNLNGPDVDLVNNKEHKAIYDEEIKRQIIAKILQFEVDANSYSPSKLDEYYHSLIANNTIFKYVNMFGVYALDKTTKAYTDFFLYTQTWAEGQFKYNKLIPGGTYKQDDISNNSHREVYRSFLIDGYKNIYLNKFNNQIFTIDNRFKDYYISFGGVFFDDKHDEKYTYINSKINDSNVKIYGYKKDSRLIKLSGSLFEDLYNYKGEHIPLVINEVVSHEFDLQPGSIIELPILNKTTRYTNKINKIIGKPIDEETTQKFEVIGINQTYINNELITRKDCADQLLGLDEMFTNKVSSGLIEEPFNGIMTDAKVPEQVIGSSTLYSPSGYWAALNNYDIDTLSQQDKELIFDNLFGTDETWASNKPGESSVFEDMGLTKEDTKKFLGENGQEIEIANAKKSALEQSNNKYSSIFNKSLYIALATSIDSKDIEAGFTLNIANTVESLLVSIIVVSFVISITILIIISTILINENQRNIAILSILGYSQQERIKTIFFIFVPFIVFALILSIPITILTIKLFTGVILNSSSIFLPLHLTVWPVFVTTIIIFSVFLITTSIAWYAINKMKAIDLLKGK
ncbi:Uncharacterized ABC transporter permease MG468 homolog [Mycoplasmopsis californica]|uniref:ABC transporter permease n=1 Tax=Mycoplasmopsis equigenitalium TaxID=114883 RepID=A0ABY5J0Z1_9BACT|nr:ABC transporter permease [Mycoplasmopsis equigenitalium]UUD36889.1 ABC transporter permease [Mycoplasmopsis equigenitalium]VEU69816.1 Uncharacterized ABC transporter permease MG468 homolog [Mycoplasmopsis californica]